MDNKREMLTLIATKIMGWTVLPESDYNPEDYTAWYIGSYREGEMLLRYSTVNGERIESDAWNPYRSWGHAGMIVDALRDTHSFAIFGTQPHSSCQPLPICAFSRSLRAPTRDTLDRCIYAMHENIPTAITLAAYEVAKDMESVNG
jgi:hypothetical protein